MVSRKFDITKSPLIILKNIFYFGNFTIFSSSDFRLDLEGLKK